MLSQAQEADLAVNYLIRDNDNCYVREFESVFEQADVQVISTAIRAPNQNAYVERWIGSIKRECLNRFIVFGNSHLNHIVSEYVDFYNELRPHQHKGNKPLTGVCLAGNEPLGKQEEIICHSRLGGVLKHYERLAA